MFEVATPLAALFTAMGPRVFGAVPPIDVAALTAAAEAVGEARGRAVAVTELEPLKSALASAIQAAEAAAVIDCMTLQPLFYALVSRIASVVIDAELRQSPEGLQRLVATALAAIETKATQVRLSERDAALLAKAGIDVPVVVDPALADGDIRVDAARHVVAESLPARLAEIVAGLS